MSIINDALKKVQQTISKNEKKSPEKTVPPFPLNQDTVLPPQRIPKSLLGIHSSQLPKTSLSEKVQSNSATIASALPLPEHRKYQKILITLCGLICAILVCMIVYLAFIFSSTRPTGIVVAKKEKAKPVEEIVLKGIMVRDDKNMALINDEIYEAGETVKGRKILKITEDSVQILDHHRVKTISVKTKKK
jgi:hypothetical protein